MVKPVYVIPNLITTGSLFSGLLSIIVASQGNYVQASYLILLSAVLDALDGPVARLTRSTSEFGVQYDSLADLVAFGIAPAFLMYNKLSEIDAEVTMSPHAPRMAIGLCGLYAICGALRLARYNVQADQEEKTTFTGMPIPAAAGTVVSTFLIVEQYFADEYTKTLHRAILVLMLILSYLMVSTYPFPGLKAVFRRYGASLRGLVTVVFFTFIVLAFKEHIALIAFSLVCTYITFAVIRFSRKKRRRRYEDYSPGESLDYSSDDEVESLNEKRSDPS